MKRTLEKELQAWKGSKHRYPFLLRGARQVGKTYLIEEFGAKEFDSFVSVNFEAQPEATACFASLDPKEILMRLQAILQQSIQPGKTLLFLDEIQVCPQAIMSLRYFKEKLPELHVIGAGSLLEFSLIQGKFSFPVGRIQFMYLKPLSFYEYALARISHTQGKDHPYLSDHLSDLSHRQYLADIGSSRCQKFDQTGCVPLSPECEKRARK